MLNSLAVSATAAYLVSHPPTAWNPGAALVHGYATAIAWAAGLLAAMAAAMLVMIGTTEE